MTKEKSSLKPIDEEKLRKKLEWDPNPWQQRALKALETRNEIIINGGRRGGKSAWTGYVAHRMLLEKNKRIWIAAPSYNLAKKPFDYIVRFLGRSVPSATSGVRTRPHPQIEVPWGSWVECKSAGDPKSFLGEEVDLLIIEEAATFDPYIFENYLFPVVSSRGAQIIYISTPWGMNWFYYKHLELKEDPKGEYIHFESRENPHFTEEEWERAKNKLSEDAFNQNYRALFLEDGATVFKDFRQCIGDPLGQPEPDHFYVVSADIAKHKDYTVIVVMDKFSGEVKYIERFHKQPYPEVKNRIVSAARQYGTTDVIIDSTGLGDPVADWLRMSNLNVKDFKFGNVSKAQMVEKMKMFFSDKKVVLPDYEPLIDELGSFSQDITPSGKLKYEAPQGFHDDCVDALGMAIWQLPTLGTQINPHKKEDIRKRRKRKFEFK